MPILREKIPYILFLDITCSVRQIADDTYFASTLTPCERTTLWGQRSVSSMEVCWRVDSNKLFSHFDGDGMVDPFQMCTCPPLYSSRPKCTLLTLNGRLKEIRIEWSPNWMFYVFLYALYEVQMIYKKYQVINIMNAFCCWHRWWWDLRKRDEFHCTCSHIYM